MALNDYVHKGEFDRRVKLLEQKIQESANRLISDYRTFAERVNSIVSENGDFNQYAAIVDRINSCFDTNGQFDGSHIAPLSIETAALSVGQRSQALNLKNVKFNVNEYVRQTTDSTQPNYYNYGVLSVTDENSGQTIGDYGILTHYTLFNNSQGEAIGDATFNIAYSDIPIYVQNDDDNDKLHYIYAKLPCTKASDGTYIYSKVNNENPIADIIVDKEQKTIEGGDSFTGFLWILLGTISREFTKSNGKYRIVDLNYGLTTINGRLITTGRIEGSVQNSAYFDLDLGEIGGTIKFKNNNNNDVDINGWLADKYSTIWDALYTNDTQGIFLKGVVDELSSQIDGRIDTWFGDVPPSSSVPPEEDWTTTALKNEHVGDLYYDTNTGYAYRYVLENNTYKWVQLEDSDLAEALRKASKAQEAADGKISVFSGNTSPNPPYAKGDLWVNATFIYDNIKIYDNELLTCITDSYDKVTSGNYSPGTTYYAKYASGAYYIDESVDASNFSSKIASGIYTAGSFSINHWQPANRALAEIDNIIDDEIISKGSEKESLRREFESITATYSNILAAIGEFEVEADVETEKDALDDAYDALDDIMDIILDNINEDTSIINDLNMTTQGFRSLWSTYYSAEAALNDAIQKAAQDKIQATIDTANDELNAVKNGTTEIAGGMITSNLIELREITDSVEETYYVQCNNDSKFHNISNYYYTKSGNTYNVISSLNENTFNSNKSNYYIQKKKYKGGDVTGPVTSGLSGINNFPAFWAGGDSVKAHNVATYRNLYPDNIARYNQYSSHTGDIPSVFIDFDGFSKFGDAYVYGGKFNWSINTNELIIGNCKLVWDNTAGMLKFMVGDKSTTSGYYSGTTRWSTFNGIYSTDAISALGANSSGGGGGGGINWADFWNELNLSETHTYSGTKIIDKSYLPINGTSSSGGTFYAPTSAGTSGQFLVSNGSGAPSWTTITRVTGVKGNSESSYRTGNVNITKANIGLGNVTNDAQLPIAGGTMTGILKIKDGLGIESESGNGLLAYKPTAWSYVTNAQWGLGSNDCQGVIRSNNSNLLHSKNGTSYAILDASNYNSYSPTLTGTGASGTWGISISGNAATATTATYLGSSNKGSATNPIYLNAGTPTACTYSLSSTINAGTANALAYYSGTNTIDDALHLRYYEGSSTATTPASYYRLHLYGSTYGNTAANMISGTAGLFSFGDGGPQITFDTYATPGGGQAGALIFTDNDTAATGASWHFVSNQSDWNVTSKRFHARTGISIGTNLPNTSYNFYVSGTSYLNGVTEIPNLLYINDYIRLGQGGNIIDGYRKSTSSFTNLHLNYYSNGNTTLSYGGGNVGIGTTSPSYKLDVAGDIKSSNNIRSIGAGEHYCEAQNSSTSCRILMDSDVNGYHGLWSNGYLNSSSTFVSGGKWLLYRNTSNEVELTGTVKVNGNFYATGAVTALQSSSSDKRLKKNIKSFNATEIIEKLKPVQFEWNNKAKKYNSNFKDGKNYGLIAQDSDGIVDDLVFDLPDNSGYKGVRYEKLIPILLQAVKEQQKEIDKLNSIVKQLKKK